MHIAGDTVEFSECEAFPGVCMVVFWYIHT